MNMKKIITMAIAAAMTLTSCESTQAPYVLTDFDRMDNEAYDISNLTIHHQGVVLTPNGKTAVFDTRTFNDIDVTVYGDSTTLVSFSIKLDSTGNADYAYLMNSTQPNIADSVYISDSKFYMSKENYELVFNIK